MQETVTRGVDSFTQSAIAGQIRLRRVADTRRGRAGAVVLWRETMQIISTHSAPILVYMMVGLAGASILGALVGVMILAAANPRTARFNTFPGGQIDQILVQAIAGFFTFIFARGAITWIAMHTHDERTPTVGAAFRATLKRWPALLAQSVVYGLLITLGVTGLTFLLHDLRLDVANVGRFYTNFSDLPRQVGVRTLSTVLPDPGSPFSDILTLIRTNLNRPVAQSFFAATSPSDPSYASFLVPPALWSIGLGCVIILVLTETLLQLRTVMVMRADGPGSVAGLTDSLRIGLKYFGYITAQVWLVRLVTVVIGALFTTIPLIFVQMVSLPLYSRQIGSYWLYSASLAVFSLGSMLIEVMWITFAIVFDTRLYAAIKIAGE